MNEADYKSDHIEAQLAHLSNEQVRKAYNSATYLKQRRALLNDWAAILVKHGL